jgi:hypothetical protein
MKRNSKKQPNTFWGDNDNQRRIAIQGLRDQGLHSLADNLEALFFPNKRKEEYLYGRSGYRTLQCKKNGEWKHSATAPKGFFTACLN